MLGELQQRLPKVSAVRVSDALTARAILRRLFPEPGVLHELRFGETPTSEHRADSYLVLTDVELAAGLRLVALCQVGSARAVLFSRMYERALLDSPAGVEYRSFLRKEHDASFRAAGTPTERLEDITHVTSERNYVRVYLRDGTDTRIRGVMDHWQLLLAEPDFVRVGRSVILNLTAVQRVQKVARDLSLVVMSGAGRPIRLGRKATAQLFQLLEQHATQTRVTSARE
jgi:hypothetical protein